MAVTETSFRTHYPEFASTLAYPPSAVTYWLGQAKLMLNCSRWRTNYDNGLELFTAHNLVIEAQALAEAKAGAAVGVQTGPVSAKSVGPVSVSYDTASGIDKDAGHWNLTVYGTRFIHLARMMGSGGLQV